VRLMTDRLELVAGTAELARADLEDRARFARLLNAQVPPAWPPPLNDEASMEWAARMHEANPGAHGWGVWYFLLRDDVSGERVAIGNGGFKGPPTPTGTVEIGYSFLEEHHGKGYATEAVGALLVWAFGHADVRVVAAETLAQLTPSIRLLEKCGFRLVGPGLDPEPGSIRYELPRERYQERNPPQIPKAP
jgi:ribosomal-protein-alanine N-acetyltransferase